VRCRRRRRAARRTWRHRRQHLDGPTGGSRLSTEREQRLSVWQERAGSSGARRAYDAPRRRGVFDELGRGPDRPRHEVAATVGADAAQDLVDAASAERALERADPGVGTVRRQVGVAAFAVRAELQHVVSVRRQPERRPNQRRRGAAVRGATAGAAALRAAASRRRASRRSRHASTSVSTSRGMVIRGGPSTGV